MNRNQKKRVNGATLLLLGEGMSGAETGGGFHHRVIPWLTGVGSVDRAVVAEGRLSGGQLHHRVVPAGILTQLIVVVLALPVAWLHRGHGAAVSHGSM